ncbi:MAG: alpha/beta fold hydrolase [Terriglobia bacterium]
MTPVPGTSVVEALTQVWERVLGRSPILPDDGFFDIGGNPSLALRLFEEISQQWGRDLTPLLILQSPTPSSLAACLELPSTPALRSLVVLKKGSMLPPVFITHGLGGTALELFELSQSLRLPHPVFGLQARGLDGLNEPFNRIEDMAEFFVGQIRGEQASGPYYLIGYSLGGLVMLEVSRQLFEGGEEIGLLALIDSYPHPCRLSPGERVRLIGRGMGRDVSRFRLSAASAFHLGRFRRAQASPEKGLRSGLPIAGCAGLAKVRDAAYQAWTHYEPHPYRGPVKFIRAQVLTNYPAKPAAAWKSLLASLEVESAPGNHAELIGSGVESLGRMLTEHLVGAMEGRYRAERHGPEGWRIP